MGTFSFAEALIFLISFCVLIPMVTAICAWFCIVKKAGFSSGWKWLIWVPVVNLAVLWVFAFIEWPTIPKKEPATRESGDTP